MHLAILNGAGGVARPARIEILTSSGESCGTVSLPVQACAVDVARDGTVLTVQDSARVARADMKRCTWAWWGGLLR